MTCWDILGIEPTGDLERIRQAYERQIKFASDDEARALEQALREAMGDAPPVHGSVQSRAEEQRVAPEHTVEAEEPEGERELDASEAQIVREVVIQIKALMNDDRRQQDAGIWRAILCEPPADQHALRLEIGRQLAPRIRPMAENGAFPLAVAQFMGEWFGWSGVQSASQAVDSRNSDPRNSDPRNYPESDMAPDQDQDSPEQPPMTNFWPAVIGWIVGLVILATLFGGMGG